MHSMKQEFPLISAPEVLAIPIEDNGELLVHAGQASGIVLVEAPDDPAKIGCYALVREGIAVKLKKAQSLLPTGYRLRLHEGYRSLVVQQAEFDRYLKETQKRHPDLDAFQQFKMTTKLVSPVIQWDGSINIPTHNTVAAVDVDIIDDTGRSLDFGMQIQDWESVPTELCETHSSLIVNEKVRSNRALLLEIMTTAGFVNYFTEWWHFSYGDRYWALLSNHSQACYGGVELFIK
jgi:D-alanyl-D-alanine dipeptidase